MVNQVGDQKQRRQDKRGEHAALVSRDLALSNEHIADDEEQAGQPIQRGIDLGQDGSAFSTWSIPEAKQDKAHADKDHQGETCYDPARMLFVGYDGRGSFGFHSVHLPTRQSRCKLSLNNPRERAMTKSCVLTCCEEGGVSWVIERLPH